MNLKEVITILRNDEKFKQHLAIGSAVFVVSLLTAAIYNLEKRIEVLEYRTSGEVEVSLEPIAKTSTKVGSSLLYNNQTMIKMPQAEFECLARNIYHEARFEPYVGQIAVAQVTFNRVQDGKWGEGFCDVVYAHKQFSWTLNPRLRNKQLKGKKWHSALQVAQQFQYGTRVKNLENAKHYHASYISPIWRKDFKQVARIGLHIFYEKNGSRRLLADAR